MSINLIICLVFPNLEEVPSLTAGHFTSNFASQKFWVQTNFCGVCALRRRRRFPSLPRSLPRSHRIGLNRRARTTPHFTHIVEQNMSESASFPNHFARYVTRQEEDFGGKICQTLLPSERFCQRCNWTSRRFVEDNKLFLFLRKRIFDLWGQHIGLI